MRHRHHRHRRYRSPEEGSGRNGAHDARPREWASAQGNADRNRLYRDRERGMLAGVCAGIADYFGFSLAGTRIATVMLALVLLPWVFIGYIALAMMLPVKTRPLYRDEEEEQFWRSVRRSPISTLSQVRHQFREMEVRMQRMERYVTSSRFKLDRDFRELER
jgi:phage shock protein C